ncbi:MAG: hypothetical protein HFE81_01945 [Bacilli bacterium]|nr:hypothetical protein [Bacilli bacterium]
MAKKSSGTNALTKLNQQIKELSVEKASEEKESVPVISKKDIEEVIKKTPITKSTTKKSTSKRGNVRDKIIVADSTKTRKKVSTGTTKKTTNKVISNTKKISKPTTEVGESTTKIRKLEDEMRSLYDRVNNIIEDLDYEKTIVETDDIILNDFVTREKIEETKLDKVSTTFLDKMLKVVFIIFMSLFTVFIGFVIFVSTF